MALLSNEEREALFNNPAIWGEDEEGTDSQPADDSVSESEQEAQEGSLKNETENREVGADGDTANASDSEDSQSESDKDSATAGDTAADNGDDTEPDKDEGGKQKGTNKGEWVPRTRLQAVIKQRNEREAKLRELELKVAQFEERNRAYSETVKYFQNERAAKLANNKGGNDGDEDYLAALERIVNGGNPKPNAQQAVTGTPSQQQQAYTGKHDGTHSDPVQQAMANLKKEMDDRFAAMEQQRQNEIAAQRLAQETKSVAEQYEFFKNDANLQKLRQMHYIVHQNYQPRDANDAGPTLMQVAQEYLKDIEHTAKSLGFTKRDAQADGTPSKTNAAGSGTKKKDAPPRAGSSVGATSKPRVPDFKKDGSWKDQARDHAFRLLDNLGYK